LNEQELIGRFRQGDEPAFRWLVDRLSSRIYYTVLNILQDPDDAEDALQETFIQDGRVKSSPRCYNQWRRSSPTTSWRRISTPWCKTPFTSPGSTINFFKSQT